LKTEAKGKMLEATLQETTPLTPYQGELEGRRLYFETTFIVDEKHGITRFER
jgi:hypothetical protein